MIQRTRNARPYKVNTQKGTKMKCKHCNYDIPDGVKFCPICGGKQDIPEGCGASAPPPPQMYGYPPQNESVTDSPKFVGFGGAIALYFKNFVNFRGRSTRSEYWFAFLFVELIMLCCWFIGFVVPGISVIAELVFFVPSLAIAFRRFHDAGKTGMLPLVRTIVSLVWKMVMGALMIMLLMYAFGVTYGTDFNDNLFYLTLIGASAFGIVPFGLYVWQIVVCCFDSETKPNKYGREPRY